ncbi:MAG: molecular chaperone TorD family protein [Magnetococcales bacterium]|nr:molecular chaperone TorD family protein [Magnetococcales bacterium]
MPTLGKFDVIVSRMEARQLLLLAGLLAYPEEASYAVLVEVAATDAPWLAAALPELQAIALDAWQGEHTRLFINGFPKTICPPFESVWRHGCMAGAAAEQLSILYQQAGLEWFGGSAPDYLGVILECVAYCLTTSDDSLQSVLEQLVTDHLRLWVPTFAATLSRETDLVLYRLLGEQLQKLFGDP